MEVVVRAKVPPGKPNGKVVAHTKEPDDGEVGKRNDARSVRHVSQPLLRLRGETTHVSFLLILDSCTTSTY
jgi:hypothetical protein